MEVGRFAGVLILHQFASFAPPFFYPHMEDALPAIWYPLRDPRVSLHTLKATGLMTGNGQRASIFTVA
jgi:hypothetical protein